MDRFEAMAMFVTVTETGSLSAAGRTLNVPLATVSRKISDLETLLGTRLLTRTTRRLSLTDAGMVYLEAARRILEQVEDAEHEASGEFTMPKGELVVTAPIMFSRLHVVPVVAAFLDRYPDIRIRLVTADRNVDLVEAHVDMALRFGTLPDSAMVATQVGVMRTVVCASPALLEGRGVPKTPDDLSTMPCVGIDTPLPSPGWRFRDAGSATIREMVVAPRLLVTTADSAAEAAIAGVGVVRLLHYQVADALRSGELQSVLEPFELDPVPVHLVHASRGQMPLKMRRFLDFAAPLLREALKTIGAIRSD